MSRLQQKKRISIGEGGSSLTLIKTTLIIDPEDKGKVIHVEPSAEEKQRLQDLEIETLRQMNKIIMQGKDDPPSLNKGNLNNFLCYETIESTTFGEE